MGLASLASSARSTTRTVHPRTRKRQTRFRTAMCAQPRGRRMLSPPTARRAPTEASRGRTPGRSHRRPRRTAATQSRSGLQSRPAARRRAGRRRATTTTMTTCPCCRRGGARRSARASSARTWTRSRGRCGGAPAPQASQHSLQSPPPRCPDAVPALWRGVGAPAAPACHALSPVRSPPHTDRAVSNCSTLPARGGHWRLPCWRRGRTSPRLHASPGANGPPRARAQNLDFDFEKCCAVSLSPVNVYACLVCGKYFQARAARYSRERFPTPPLPRFRRALPAASCL